MSKARLIITATGLARVRRHVWAQLAAGDGIPASKVAGSDLGPRGMPQTLP